MIKNILNLGDAAAYCDFGKEVNQEINTNVINYFTNIKEKKIPLGLINARITNRSFKKWNKISFFSKYVFNKFDFCLAQNSETKNYLKKLGASNIKKIGNLKFSETSFKGWDCGLDNFMAFLRFSTKSCLGDGPS